MKTNITDAQNLRTFELHLKAGTTVKEFAHVVWADKVDQLAAAIPDTNGLLIGADAQGTAKGNWNWVHQLDIVLQSHPYSDIDKVKAEKKEAWDLWEQVRKL